MWQPDPVRQRNANHTVEDLLDHPGDDRYEVTDGILRVIPSRSARHQSACALLTSWLSERAPHHLTAVQQVSIAFALDSTREADVLLARRGQTHDRQAFLRPFAVELVAEVVAPGSAHTDRVLKPAEYAAAGIPHYWRIEQNPVHVYAYELGADGHYALVADSADLLEVERPFPIRLPIAEITP